MATITAAVVMRKVAGAAAVMTFHRVACPCCARVQGAAVVYGALKRPLRRYVCRFCGEVVGEDGWQEVEDDE